MEHEAVKLLKIRFSALVKCNQWFDTRCNKVTAHCVSHSFHIVSGEGAEVPGSLTGTDIPTVIAFFHHVYRVAFFQLELVLVLGSIVVQSSVSEVNLKTLINKQIRLIDIYFSSFCIP